MSLWTRSALAVLRLDAADVVRSRWMSFAVAVYAALAAVFVLVGLRESAITQFTGMSRVLMNFCHALVLVLPLLALTATAQTVPQARDDGTLEFIFGQPVPRSSYLVAVSASRFGLLVVPLVVLLLLMTLLGWVLFGQPAAWNVLATTIGVGASLAWAFVGLGIAISTHARTQTRAMILLLLVWAMGVALLDFALVGMMLQWRLGDETVLLLASANPVQSARLALVAAIDPEFGWLGPVGTFLAGRVGTAKLALIGVLWPLAVGCLAWSAAWVRFRRDDVV